MSQTIQTEHRKVKCNVANAVLQKRLESRLGGKYFCASKRNPDRKLQIAGNFSKFGRKGIETVLTDAVPNTFLLALNKILTC